MTRGWLFLFYTLVIHALALLGLLDLTARLEIDIRQSVEIPSSPTKLWK